MRGQRGERSKASNQDSSSTFKGKDEPQKVRNELTEEQKREIKDAFSSFEEGGLMPDELKLAMKALGFDPRNEDVQKIMQKVENQGNKPN